MKKICTKCKQTKNTSEFNKCSACKDGLQSACKECHRQYDKTPSRKEWYKSREFNRIRDKWHQNEYINSTEKVLLREAKFRAKKHGLEFNLDLSDIIIPEICPILKTPITRNRRTIEGKKIRIHTNPSIDRIDNNKGYIKGNVWIISSMANMMKTNATLEQLITFSKSILKIFKDGNTNNLDINDCHMY